MNLSTSSMLIILSMFSFISAANIHAEEKTLSFEVTEVAPNLYMLKGINGSTGGNLGLSVGDDGVILIDDSMSSSLGIMNDAIKSITEHSIDFLINTHVHGDHIGNNEYFGKAGSWIIAHKNLRRHLLDKGVQVQSGMAPAPKNSLPVITFNHSMNIHLNGYDAFLFHTPKAHTDGDAVIHFKDVNVIHSGDTLFNGIFPYIDIDGGGSLRGFIAAQERLLSLSDDQTKIIPGHGPLANKADIKSSLAMLKDSRNTIEQLIDAGKTEDEIVDVNPLAPYHSKWNWGFITTEKMTRQVYKGIVKDREYSKQHKMKHEKHMNEMKHTHDHSGKGV